MSGLYWFDPFPTPLIIAHRGSSLEAPENTMAAFNLAAAQGADAIELDLTRCGSGELVVIHDSTVDRTTNGTGKVGKMPLSAIQSLDAGSYFDARFKGEKVSTLDEVLESVGRKCLVNIELKNFSTPFDSLADQAAACVQRHNLQHRVFFSSFNPFNFRKIKRHLPDSPMGLLTIRGKSGRFARWLYARIGPYDAMHPHFADADSEFIGRAHQRQQPVLPYTVNKKEELEMLYAIGVDGVITDDPALAVNIRNHLVNQVKG